MFLIGTFAQTLPHAAGLVRLIEAEGANMLPSDIAPALEGTVRAHFAKPIASE